jgi:hypothetical protein
MMKKLNEQERLLREYIESTLLEYEGDDGGYGGSSGYADLGGGSGYFRGFERIFKVFIGKSKELMQRVKGAVSLTLEAVAGICLPFVNAEYGKILEETNKNVASVRKEFQKVYDSSSEVLGKKDAQFLMFMVNPTQWITGKFLETAPDVAVDVLDTATGGKMTGFLGKVKNAVGYATKGAALHSGYTNLNSSRHYHGTRLSEDKDGEKSGIDKEKLAKILRSPKVIEFIKNNPNIQNMQSRARQVIDKEIEDMVELAASINEVKTLGDLQKVTGKKVSETSARAKGKLIAELLGTDPKKEQQSSPNSQQEKMKGEQGGASVEDVAKEAKISQQKIDATKLATAKKMMKDFLTKKLKEKIADAKKAGAEDDDYVVVKYQEAITKIQGA